MSRRFIASLCLFFFVAAASSRLAAQNETEEEEQSELEIAVQERPDRFFFGRVGEEEPVEHTFFFQNTGGQELEIENVQLMPPLSVTKMTSQVAPGEQGSVTVRLGTPREKEEFQGQVVINFKNSSLDPLIFWMIGEVVAPIEFQPMPVFFVTTQRGQSKQDSIEIINHEELPLEILRVENPSTRFTTDLETLEAGQHYRLRLTLNGDGPGGKATDTITLVTFSEEHPFLEIKANTWVKERVYSSPDSLDFGQISAQYLKSHPHMRGFLSQTLMVYQMGGEGFEIGVQTDVPFLSLSPARSKFKDRYQIEVAVIPEKLKSGAINGSIIVVTNDPEFPQLVVPVKAVVEGSW